MVEDFILIWLEITQLSARDQEHTVVDAESNQRKYEQFEFQENWMQSQVV